MRVCTHCNAEKPEEEFDRFFDRSRDKYRTRACCKSCRRKKITNYDKKNCSKKKVYNKAYAELNSEKIKKHSKEYYNKNKDSILAYLKYWRDSNPDKVARGRLDRVKNVRRAIPPWTTDKMVEDIKMVYLHAKDCAITSGCEYEVDHIVPIKGKTVCGLHVPWNLQVLPKDINRSKTNNYDDWK